MGLAALWTGRAREYQKEADIIREGAKRAGALASEFTIANSAEAGAGIQEQPRVQDRKNVLKRALVSLSRSAFCRITRIIFCGTFAACVGSASQRAPPRLAPVNLR